MMDKIEYNFLAHIPPRSMSLRLARATIRMRHDRRWRVDKINPAHDLIICLSGRGCYQVGEDPEEVEIGPGEALLIPAYTRFRGAAADTEQGAAYTGIAQHFTLDLFGKGDMIEQMALRRVVPLPSFAALAPLLRHYRDTAPHGSTTLAQHHQFMVFLLDYLEAAFIDWRSADETPDAQDHLSVQIMLAATRLSADPLGSGVEEVMRDVPYNADYFRRAFKDRLGHTPQKFRELKRMEFAANRLGMGLSVKAVAGELGYADPYFFSRMFKRYLGASPSTYRDRQVRR
ncbi:helix-turn-helix domain-containing protein [Poseidonocella sedimentorum]|uniref:Helix-turn-helix domain-containing protein n=1 Tax=Poseidonocella sedimentorum TaxID=871652 RepID=A0A1I6EPU5_9RHOB|nr:helix-turn-helix transcriptional regulator [Poseidonocella sedimentorum]SFR19627.1 Helix-turn-helix domain-containing protein [Poseidonocella sedimentorum]